MLKGHTYGEQVFANKAFRLFINTFLNGEDGIINGCNLSNSANTITITNGFFCVQGGLLEIVGEEQVELTLGDAFCKLVCEIDLSKQNTESDFLQAEFKVIKSTSSYPATTKENLFENGNIYQLEFAQFKTTSVGITEFRDLRKHLNFDSIYSSINTNFQAIVNELEEKIEKVEDGSAFMLSDKIVIGTEYPEASDLREGQIYLQYFEEE